MSPKPIGYVIGIAGVTDEQSLLQAIFDGIGNENKVLSADSVEVASVHDLHIDRYLQQNGDYIYVVSKNGPQIGLINGVKGEFIDTSGYLPEKNIGLQTETRSNEQVSVTLPNTTLSILYPQSNNTWSISPSDDDYPQPWPTNYETLYEKYSKTTENPFDFTTWAKKHWTETVWPYPANTIEYDLDDCVSTKEKAAKFIDDTDQALKYLLRSSTKLGAQVSRLDFTADVLTVKNENLTQSESVIRDADMAQSISDKLKYDTLLKASQSMLAQANQQMQSILQFLE
jgi:flagellin-like hook-associated protein FlgL